MHEKQPNVDTSDDNELTVEGNEDTQLTSDVNTILPPPLPPQVTPSSSVLGQRSHFRVDHALNMHSAFNMENIMNETEAKWMMEKLPQDKYFENLQGMILSRTLNEDRIHFEGSTESHEGSCNDDTWNDITDCKIAIKENYATTIMSESLQQEYQAIRNGLKNLLEEDECGVNNI